MEAMASGSVLIVDDRGGWQDMVKHGETGWLCKDSRDFVYYSSRMAYEKDERDKMAKRGREWLSEMNDKERCKKAWEEIFV
jgi:glycosyltransferase involved in cell wall biosynthesis